MSKTVVVACRLPHGLIAEVGQFGAPDYQWVKFNGPFSRGADGQLASLVVNGHAFTQVKEEFWNAWREAHKGALYLKNRMIYAEDTLAAAQDSTNLAEAKGKTGFEPLNPDNAPEGVEANQAALKAARAEAKSLTSLSA